MMSIIDLIEQHNRCDMLYEDDSKAADAMTDAAERLQALPARPMRRGALKVPKTAEVIAQWLRREMR